MDNINLYKRIPATTSLSNGKSIVLFVYHAVMKFPFLKLCRIFEEEPPKRVLSLQDKGISTTINNNKPLSDGMYLYYIFSMSILC